MTKLITASRLRNAALLAVLALPGAYGAAAAEACTATLAPFASFEWRNGQTYDPLHPATLSDVKSFQAFADETPEGCNFMIAVQARNGGNIIAAEDGSGGTLNIDIVPSASMAPVAMTETVARTDAGFSISLNQFVGAGRYTGAFDVVLYDVSAGSPVELDREEYDIDVSVQARSEISFSSGNWTDVTKSLTFPSMTAGTTVDTPIFVRSNTAYEISVNSENGGYLKNITATGADIKAKYDTTLDGAPVVVGTPEAAGGGASFPRSSAAFAPQQHLLAFKLASGTGIAGQYRDTVTIVVRSLE